MPVLLPVLPAAEFELLLPGMAAPGMVPPGGIAPGVMVPVVVLLVVPGVTVPMVPEEGVGAGVGTWFALMLPEGWPPLAPVVPVVAPCPWVREGWPPLVPVAPLGGTVAPVLPLLWVVLPGLVLPGPVCPIGGAMLRPELLSCGVLGPDMVPGPRPSVVPRAPGVAGVLGEVVSEDRAVPVAPPCVGVAAGLAEGLGMLAEGAGCGAGAAPTAGVFKEDCAKATLLNRAMAKAGAMVRACRWRIGVIPLVGP